MKRTEERTKLKIQPLDFSTYDENKNNESLHECVANIMKQISIEIDKEHVKELLLKAKLYDLNCNPYTVAKHKEREFIGRFCSRFLYQIKEEKLTKKQIIKIIEGHTKK